MNHLKIILKWVLPNVKFAYNMLAVSAEVFCRHSFGARYTPAMLAGFIFCFLTMTIVCGIDPDKSSPAIGVYLFIYFVLLIYHGVKMWLPRAVTHSQSSGLSWAFWGRITVFPALVRILLEPAIHVLVGVALHPMSVLLSDWLIFAGICLAIKEFISFWKHWNRVLDSSDARIEGERITSGVRRYSAPRSGGDQRVSHVAAVEQAQAPADSIQQIYSRLDPALQQLVAMPNQNRPNAPTPNRPVVRPAVVRNQARPVGIPPGINRNRNRT